MGRLTGFLSAVFAAILLSACAMSTLQTAKTLDQGHGSIGIGGTVIPAEGSAQGGFTPEIGFHYGITKRLEGGIRLFSLGFMGEIKYGIVRSETTGPSLALLGAAGYSKISDLGFFATDFGALVSYELGGIAPYAGVKYRYYGFDKASGTSDTFLDEFSGEFTVLTFGLSLFSTGPFSIYAEADIFKSFSLFDDKVSSTDSRVLYSAGFGIKF